MIIGKLLLTVDINFGHKHFYLSMNKTRVERSCNFNNNKGWPKGDADNNGDRVGGFLFNLERSRLEKIISHFFT